MNDVRKTKRSPRLTADDNQSGWLTVEVDGSALTHNIREMRRLVAAPTRLMAVVKANAYGHGLLLAARAFLAGDVDVLGVHSWREAEQLRLAGIEADILILGPVNPSEAAQAAKSSVAITVSSVAALHWAAACGADLSVHLKVETGVNRQGVVEAELPAVKEILAENPHLKLAGLSSHFADIEDTTNHEFARSQMERFASNRRQLDGVLSSSALVHMSCSAATLLWPEIHGGLARVGISAYGIWPSRETLVSFRQSGHPEVDLRPAATWKCQISQVRQVAAGETVGYGRSWKAMSDSEIAVLPVGYSDGLPRSLGNSGFVLVGGYRAPFVGRMCMNLCMVDVSRIPGVKAGDQAVLLGRQGEEEITAEMLAAQLGTIAYEILTLPGDTWDRVLI